VPVAEALAITHQVISGLGAAHAVNVVHRDLKPGNVMLTSRAGRRVVIMDFGLARVFDPASTGDTTRSTVSAIVGTLPYMAPEQIAGGTATPRTDIYALGLLLYEILRGQRPFGDSTHESWLRRAREKPPRLSGVVPGVDQRIDDVIARCLEYEPGRRFRSVEDVWAALQRPSLAFVPRHRLVQIAAAGAAVATVALVWQVAIRQDTPPSPDAIRAHADAARDLAEGAAVRALNNVTRALELSPRFAAAQALRAEILLELDMPARAQEAILRASESGPSDPADTAYIDGIRQLLLRDCDAAVTALRRYGDGAPAASRPYRLLPLPRALERCGRPDEAQKALARAAELDQWNAAVPLRQARLFALQPDYAKAGESLDRAEKLFREQRNFEGVCEVLVARGTLQAAQEDLDRAEATLSEARQMAETLDDVRQQVRVRLQMAIVKRKRGDVATAEQLTTEAVELARRNSLETLTLEGLFANGNVHMVQNQFQEALALFKHARAIGETNRHEQYLARADVSLASAYVRMMEPDHAEKAVRAALLYFERAGQARNAAAANILLGQVQAARLEYPAALAQFERALATAERAKDSEQELRAREDRATVLSAMGRYPDALAEYQYLLAEYRKSGRTPSETYAHLNISDTLSRMGRFSGAAAALREAEALIEPAAEINARRLIVSAGNAFREGRYATAWSDARKSIAVGSGRSIERAARGNLIACAAGARLRRPDAPKHCAEARSVDRLERNLDLWLEVQFVDAEVKLTLGTSTGVAQQLTATLALLDQSHSLADRWRYFALLAGASVGTARVDAHEQLTNELDALRASWGELDFQTWIHRSDVRSLLSMAPLERIRRELK
jgi:tetratricopeptide (TPR) repeat protein